MYFSQCTDILKRLVVLAVVSKGLGKGPTKELEHILTVEKMHSINFTDYNKKIFV